MVVFESKVETVQHSFNITSYTHSAIFLKPPLSGVQRETDGIEKTDGQRLRIILYYYTHNNNKINSIH